MPNKNIIQLHNVTFTYPGSHKAAIDNLNLNIEKGSWTTIIGHNGSGKSTITRLINGLLVPDKSDDTYIEVDGIKLTEDTVWDIRDRVGIVFQNPDNQFVGATVADDVAFGLENRGVPHQEMQKIVSEAIKSVGMSNYTNMEPSNLSGGQKQRVAIAGVLAVKPKIIILDESTSMLDPEGREQILTIIKNLKEQNNLTVISITHDINEAAIADEVIVLNDGKLISKGTPKVIFTKDKLLHELGLDIPFEFKLRQKLIEKDISIPNDIQSEKELVKYLCQLNSTM
ncbi:energy-coupling factor ABC transporter ATP-binding protein [Lactobacillus sp. LL6]|uniref:energy-coupling factor ABC transporter ATP-binding protein n=1 Tax=Lactobacillus sp. LL6 TaxID=2596827 RepID=UPI00118636A8|nr:energy-coupling factor ABC transporter ATP-binding protein [Lactobacillus sp. LL6]TSO25854.1 energy-coupling factor transporter ATPase [Lactobacillus sp. LL6]